MASFIVFFLLTAAAATLGAIFTPGEWYAALVKPALTPPDWIFPVVWTVLYAMIAVAGWLLWRHRKADPSGLLIVGLWVLQLALNAAWSWIFFGLHLTGLALLEIAVLFGTILGVVLLARKTSRTASLLMTPYLAWVGFAIWLNFGIWRLNG
jgi:tryptophan-rich sensory protein